MSAIWTDTRFAFRTLRKDWLINLLAGLSLALALAGNTTVFGMVNAFLYRPLPFPEPERIVLVGERQANAPQTLTASPANLAELQENNRTFENLAGYRPGVVSVGIGDRPVSVTSATVSPGFFAVVGATPVLGRAFVAEEGVVGNHRVTVVSETFVTDRLAGLADPVGAEVRLNGEPHVVVGVMAGDFEFFFPGVELWVPLALDAAKMSRDQRSIIGVGRLLPGVTMEQTRQDLGTIWDRLVAEYPESNGGWVMDILNFRHEIPAPQARTLFGLLQGTVVIVLLIACVNIANLLSARGQRRQREIALRTILGANRLQILRQLMIESVLLAVLAGAVGLALAFVGVRLMALSLAPVMVGHYMPVVDARVLLFSLAMTLLSGILFGLLPALQSFKVDLAGSVKEGGRGVTGTAGKKLLSRGLVVAEIAMSLVLLAGGSILVRSFLELRNADAGFGSDGVLTIPVTLPFAVDNADERNAMLEQLVSTVTNMPGVETATVATTLPLNVFAVADAFSIDGRALAADEARPRALWVGAPTNYLDAMGIPLMRGRFFSAADRDGSAPVVAVSARLAEVHWPDEDPIGQRLTFQGKSREIVGLIGDTRQTLLSTDGVADAVLYVPIAQDPPAAIFVMARAAIDPGVLVAPLRTGLQELHSDLVIGRIQTLDEIVDQLFVGLNIFNYVLTGFGNLALLLASLGTYGVLAYNVTQRRQEIGVRLAMGAQQGEIVRLITRQGALLGAVGLLAGVPGVLAIVAVLRSVLVNSSPVQPGTIVAVAAVLFAATVAASVIPARRASKLDPVTVLRDQ